MPPRNQSTGFKERNKHLGERWSSYDFHEKDIFHERIFFPLGYVACGWELPPAEPQSDALTTHEIETYLPTYKQLVDIDKVARDLGQGKFGPHLPTARQNKGISEVERIDHVV